MGRRENAVAAETRQSETLALWLRAQRERRGVTYAAMAKLIGYRFTASMLSRGASGRVPSRKLVEAFAQACNADPAEAIRLWKAARRSEEELRRREETAKEFQDLATSVRSALTHPELIETFGQLRRAMIQVRAREGQPSLGYLQAEAGRTADGRHYRLPKSSLSAVLRGEAVPSREHVTAFMEALGASPRKVRPWERAWERIAHTHARQPPAVVEIRVADGPVAVPPGAPVLLMTGAGSGPDYDYLRDQVVSDYMNTDMPLIWKGPQRPYPPAGQTRSGLPIRIPRRYERPAPRPQSHKKPGPAHATPAFASQSRPRQAASHTVEKTLQLRLPRNG
ncbi:helix-turn-helix transcriptional regulator (plasmid) [Streptomyces laculatispora]|uniref:Helix-turn-helix transcriptional regulator n=1 Tax=Streptomyces laculatispora TaxID=887464 RepID=A0ABY9IHB4_9ACTN|nr:helix-turn-helix transcriptional regulator [Streptomyces laculatispora]WLQ45614.1 helix-turn-helix transcriptional regulator [Streptomyces laculatispora]